MLSKAHGHPTMPHKLFSFCPRHSQPFVPEHRGCLFASLLQVWVCVCVCAQHTWTRRVGVKVMGAQATWTSGGSPRCSCVCFSSRWGGGMDKCPEDTSGSGTQSLTSRSSSFQKSV